MSGWGEAASLLHGGAAALCLAWAGLALAANRRAWPAALACLATALWAGAVALTPEEPLTGAAGALEVLRTLAWAALLALLLARLRNRRTARALGLAAALLALLALALDRLGPGELGGALDLGSPGLLARLGLALVVLLLAENVWRSAADEREAWHVALPAIALGVLAALDVLLYADAALSGAISPALLGARAGLAALALPLLAVAARRDRRWKGDAAARAGPAVSREAVFHGATLLVSGAFLAGVGVVGEALRRSGAEWAGSAQVGLLAGAALALAVGLSSGTVRSRLRRAIADHLFAARFDYRREWLRCVATLSEAGGMAAERRAVRAVADAVDSPGGVLLLRGPAGEAEALRWAGSWNAPAAPLPAGAAAALLARLGDAPAAALTSAADAPLRAALAAAHGPVWLAVGLPHRDGLLGAVLLAPPRAPFPLDGEAFALLAAIGREVALFLAERAAAERLADQRQLAEAAQRFAFVAHDVKTVSAQLRLTLDNAGPNMADPEFQQDLLTTLRASVSRIDALVARLRHGGARDGGNGGAEGRAGAPAADAAALLRAIARRAAPAGAVAVEAGDDLPPPAMPPENFDAAVTHLLNNALEASPPGAPPVRLSARRDGPGRLLVEIEDHGPGMSAEFVRDELFRPLATTKPGGSGIGAWQARELVAQAGGALAVDSRDGPGPARGTRVALRLPAREGAAAGSPGAAPPESALAAPPGLAETGAP